MSYVLNVQILIKKNILYARLEGELDQHTVEDLRVRTSELIEKYQIRYLVLNFKKLQFMDSSGVGYIIGRYNRLKKIAGGVVLCSLNEHIWKLVLLSGLNKICTIMKNEDEVNEYLGVA
jgi:stage II sporulation protein AA (anti-sigma F factor antagonist)